MHPYLLQIGSWTLSTYGVVLAAAFVLVVRLASHAAATSLKGPLSASDVVDWACWALIGGILGGRLLYVASNWDLYRSTPLEVFALWHGGLIWYGGFFGGAAATAWYLRRGGHAVLRGFDQLIPFIALGHAIGRIGCFLNGCCSGVPTSGWCAVWFPGAAQPVVPVQLIESLALLGLYVGLRQWQTPSTLRQPPGPPGKSQAGAGGRVFGAYLVGYGAIRWVIESWRDQPHLWFGVTLQQVISAGLIALGLWLLCRARSRTVRAS